MTIKYQIFEKDLTRFLAIFPVIECRLVILLLLYKLVKYDTVIMLFWLVAQTPDPKGLGLGGCHDFPSLKLKFGTRKRRKTHLFLRAGATP